MNIKSVCFVVLLLAGSCGTLTAQDKPLGLRPPDTIKVAIKDSTDHIGVVGLPYFSYSPETELKVGIAGIISFHLDDRDVVNRRSSTISAGASASQLGQNMIATNFDLYFNRLRSRISGRVGYENMPVRYYGIGAETPQENEIWFYPLYLKIFASYFHQVVRTEDGQGFTLGGRLEYWNTEVDEELTLDPSFGAPVGWDGGLNVGLGLTMSYDTRDNAYFPTKNMYAEVRSMTYLKTMTADFGYTRSYLDLRGFTSIPIGSEDLVIGGQLLYDITLKEAPFYDLPTYGGDQMMRGILRYRFVDKASLCAQVEARARVWWVLGLAAFAAYGDVAPDLTSFSTSHARLTGGGGLRVYLDREAGLTGRIDVGFSELGTAVYFTFGEAF